MLPTKIYLSGPDGAGKSTMAESFSKVGYRISKWSRPTGGEDFVKRATEEIASDEMLVLDRGWFGDLIYAPIFKSTPIIEREDAMRLLREFIKRGGVLVYVRASAGALIARVKERGDEHVTTAMLPVILHQYDQFFFNLKHIEKIPYLMVDTTNLF